VITLARSGGQGKCRKNIGKFFFGQSIEMCGNTFKFDNPAVQGLTAFNYYIHVFKLLSLMHLLLFAYLPPPVTELVSQRLDKARSV
jgi:hypothetical protein